MKTVKRKTVRQGTRRMINAQAVTPYGLLTYRGGETAFFLLRPTCISVLPEDALAARVGALVTVFKSQPELEILCLNSRESFANNTRYLEARIGEEENPYIADLLEKDKAHLGSVQLQTATAREFVLAVRLEAVREKEKYPYLARVEKLIRDQGFDVRRADLDDVKRLMAVYFVQDFTSEHYDDFDGQRWVEWTGVQADRKAPDSASQEAAVKEFLDLAAPSVLRFETDRFICGNTYRCVWAVRGYPASTTEQALLHRLGEKAGVSVHIYTRRVTPAEEKKILQNADKANRLKAGNTGNVQDVVEAESNLQDMAAMLTLAHRNQEPFLHTAVFIEMIANDPEHLRMLQSEVEAELNCCKISADHLLLRQKQGFQSVMPSGWNAFGTQYERVLPASSAANLYPMCYYQQQRPHPGQQRAGQEPSAAPAGHQRAGGGKESFASGRGGRIPGADAESRRHVRGLLGRKGNDQSAGAEKMGCGRDRHGAGAAHFFSARLAAELQAAHRCTGRYGGDVFTDETLRELRLHLHSLCVGPDSLYFNGHTNIGSGRFVTFGVKSLLEAGQNLRDAMLFNIFSYMNNELLCAGNTVAAIDELYLYLNNKTAIGYIRACMKRARKKESSLLLASQNVEDFLLPEAAELTKPLFSIPAYQFLFHPGTVDGGKYREALQLEECEYGVVRSCARGNCLFKCGDERYNLLVKTPPHKLRCYGTAGGR